MADSHSSTVPGSTARAPVYKLVCCKLLNFSQNHTYLPDIFKSNLLCLNLGIFHSLLPKSSPLSQNAVLAFWCFYNKNRKNTVEIRWVKIVECVPIYNAINSEQPTADISVPTSGCFARLRRARAAFLAIVDGPISAIWMMPGSRRVTRDREWLGLV